MADVLSDTRHSGPSLRERIESNGESFHEELANTLIHGIGAVLAAGGLALLVVLAATTESARAVTTCAIYGATVFLTLLASALYHGVWHRTAKQVFLALDHCAIFVLIAGTYTPIVLLALPQPLGWTLFGILWGLAALGITLRLVIGHLHWSLIPVFLAMGWLGFAWPGVMFHALGAAGGWLLLAGGLCYTGGLVFYLWRRLPFHHAVWHFFVLAGVVCHFLVVALYALPYA
jgi:hemolysin III